jgi:hypothetical protein
VNMMITATKASIPSQCQSLPSLNPKSKDREEMIWRQAKTTSSGMKHLSTSSHPLLTTLKLITTLTN